MADFSGWLKALELPTKITGGVFAACVLIYLLDGAGELALADIGAWVRPVVIIVGVLAGCLFLASVVSSIGGVGGDLWKKRQGSKAKAEREAKVLAHLDHLSEYEVYMVAEALKTNSPSIDWSLHAGAATQLESKGLLIRHAGQHNQNHWPYTFRDFVWREIQNRRDAFLARAEELEKERKKNPHSWM